MDLFVLAVDTSSQWIKNLIDGRDISGNNDIDQIFSEYKIEIINLYYGFDKYFLYFKTGFYVNKTPFLELFKNIENILFAEPEALAGDGSIISSSQNEETIILIYSTGWGDCPAGCINRHYWEFSVNGNIVTFLKEYGDKIP